MRELFPGYYRPTSDQTNELWSKAVFVFDANVLLAQYAYPEKARDAIFSVLEQLQDRIWIPHQVAVEFHRNRLNKIQSVNQKMTDLRNEINKAPLSLKTKVEQIEYEKWNTGITNLPQLLGQIEDLYRELGVALDAALKKIPAVSLDDPIAERLASLFTNRVGSRPTTQIELNSLFENGSERYAAKIPPGFLDEKKEATYHEHGLIYPAKYGDLILWRQILNHTKEYNIQHLVFVTDDRKEDWWATGNPGERLGPQPSLVDEFLRSTGATTFWMYTTDKFLEHAGKQLHIEQVTAQTVEQVKQAAAHAVLRLWEKKLPKIEHSYLMHELIQRIMDERSDSSSEKELDQLTIVEWAKDRHDGDGISTSSTIDFCVNRDGDMVAGYDILWWPQDGHSISTKLRAMSRAKDAQRYLIVVLPEKMNATIFESLQQGEGVELIKSVLLKTYVMSVLFVHIDERKVHIDYEIESM